MLNKLYDDCIFVIIKYLDGCHLNNLKIVNKNFNSTIDEKMEEEVYKIYVLRDLQVAKTENFISWKQLYYFCYNLDFSGKWNLVNTFDNNYNFLSTYVQKYSPFIVKIKKNTYQAKGFINEQTISANIISYHTFLNFRPQKLSISGMTFFSEEKDKNDVLLGVSFFYGNVQIDKINISNIDIGNNNFKYIFDNIEIISSFCYSPSSPSAHNIHSSGESFARKITD